MKLKYVGVHDGVDVPRAGVSVAFDEVVEVEDEIGAQLLEQEGNWEPADAAAKRAADAVAKARKAAAAEVDEADQEGAEA